MIRDVGVFTQYETFPIVGPTHTSKDARRTPDELAVGGALVLPVLEEADVVSQRLQLLPQRRRLVLAQHAPRPAPRQGVVPADDAAGARPGAAALVVWGD